jgi:2-keto-4-pentenoate hydratase/2-oxohepta-3-ene-1,7-dioic acid hydratase in catechol pathway
LRFITFQKTQGEKRVGIVKENKIIDINKESKGVLPDNMLDFLGKHQEYVSKVKELYEQSAGTYLFEEVEFAAPLPNPRTFRDFVAFETHVKNATSRNGDAMAKEWYEVPVFYFSNPHSIKGPNQEVKRPKKCVRLDFELEMACIIGKEGQNIQADEAKEYIFGYTILNDWSARDLQMQEMKVLLGPAKGKDFATSIGPYIVTKDELEPYRVGERFDLEMKAFINGKEVTHGNFKDIHYTFGQMIERASEEVTLYPGDIIGSGTVGLGCIMELGPEEYGWLKPGDVVELEITHLGKLKNQIV